MSAVTTSLRDFISLRFERPPLLNRIFVPSNVVLPGLHANPYDPDLDHEWHQYEELEWTDEEAEFEGLWEL